MWDIVMAIPLPTLLGFMATGIVLNLTPGADVVFATASGLRAGPATGALAGLGVGLGATVHVALAAGGISALLAANPGAFQALRWLGAAYLAWLAVRAWRAAPGIAGQGEAGAMAAIRRGMLTNVLNPKVALFVLAFLPQFADPSIGAIWRQILVFGVIFVATGTVITSGYGALAGWLGRRLVARGRFLNRLSALLFGGLAVRLVLD